MQTVPHDPPGLCTLEPVSLCAGSAGQFAQYDCLSIVLHVAEMVMVGEQQQLLLYADMICWYKLCCMYQDLSCSFIYLLSWKQMIKPQGSYGVE